MMPVHPRHAETRVQLALRLQHILVLRVPQRERVLDVDVGTLRNWEQGRREPTGPAKALLRAIKNDPEAVVKALAQ